MLKLVVEIVLSFCQGNMLFNPDLMEQPDSIVFWHPSQVIHYFLVCLEDVTFYSILM